MKTNFRKITNVNDIRQIVSELINMLFNDEIDNHTAQAIGSLCSLQLKIMKAVDLDIRVTKLEKGDFTNTNDKTPIESDVRAEIRKLRSAK